MNQNSHYHFPIHPSVSYDVILRTRPAYIIQIDIRILADKAIPGFMLLISHHNVRLRAWVSLRFNWCWIVHYKFRTAAQ